MTSGQPQNVGPENLVTVVAIVGQLMVILDIAVVNVAAPSIQAALGVSGAQIQWVASGYTLTFAGFLLAGGRAADLYGRRRIFVLGLMLFIFASLGAGLASTVSILVAWRLLQGLGAALLSPATLAVLVVDLGRHRQTRAVSVWAAMSGVGGGVGVLLGGLVTAALNWRWIFLINVPIGVPVLVLAWVVLRDDRARVPKASLDLAGALTVTAGMIALVFAITQANTNSWLSPVTIASATAAVLLATVFWQIESRHARYPLVPIGYLRSRVVVGANLTVLLLYSVIIAPWFLLSYYMQTVLGFDPLLAGLGLLPQALVIAGTSAVSSWIVPRWGPHLLVMAGTLLAVGGMFDMWWQVSGGRPTSYLAGVLGPLILLGLAVGCALPAVTLAATAGVPPEKAGLVSGLLNSSRQLGGALGLAILFTTGTERSEHTLPPGSVPPGYPTAALIGVGIALASFAAAFVSFGLKQSRT